MTLVETIERAVSVAGSQRELARLLGEREQHISDFKRGRRPCSYQKHAQIAAVAGMEEEAIRILLQGIADSLNDSYSHEAQAKAALTAMLNAFPESSFSGPSLEVLTQHGAAWRRTRLRWRFKTRNCRARNAQALCNISLSHSIATQTLSFETLSVI